MEKIVVFTETAAGEASFTRPGDYYKIGDNKKAFAVADSPLREILRTTRKYPMEDFGQDAAKIFCESTTSYLESQDQVTQDTIKKSFIQANENIKKFNLSIGKVYGDETKYDMAETIGASIYISEDKLTFGLLEDCYVEVLDGKTLEHKEKIKYTMAAASEFIEEQKEKGTLINYVHPQLQTVLPETSWWEPCWCNHQRNKPNFTNERGEPVGWGCFNGEDEFINFVQFGTIPLQKGDHIFLFTDGMIPILDNEDLLKWFIEKSTDSFIFGHKFNKKLTETLGNTHERLKEKTLIYIKY